MDPWTLPASSDDYVAALHRRLGRELDARRASLGLSAYALGKIAGAAIVGVAFKGTNVRFIFGLPSGFDGDPRPPGEISSAQLADAIETTSANNNGVSTLGISITDPPTQSEVQAIVSKLDELINTLRRNP